MPQVWEPQNSVILDSWLVFVLQTNCFLWAPPLLPPTGLTAALATQGILDTPSTTGHSNSDGEPSPAHRSRIPPFLWPMEFYSLHSSYNILPLENTRIYQTYTSWHQFTLTTPQSFPLAKGEDQSSKTYMFLRTSTTFILPKGLQLTMSLSSLPSTSTPFLVPDHTPISNHSRHVGNEQTLPDLNTK